MRYAVLSEGFVVDVIEWDGVAAHPQRSRLRAVPDEGSFLGLRAEDLPYCEAAPVRRTLRLPMRETERETGRLYTQAKTVKMPRPDPFDNEPGAKRSKAKR